MARAISSSSVRLGKPKLGDAGMLLVLGEGDAKGLALLELGSVLSVPACSTLRGLGTGASGKVFQFFVFLFKRCVWKLSSAFCIIL